MKPGRICKSAESWRRHLDNVFFSDVFVKNPDGTEHIGKVTGPCLDNYRADTSGTLPGLAWVHGIASDFATLRHKSHFVPMARFSLIGLPQRHSVGGPNYSPIGSLPAFSFRGSGWI